MTATLDKLDQVTPITDDGGGGGALDIPDALPKVATDEQLIAAIMAEARAKHVACSETLAVQFINLLCRAARQTRKRGSEYRVAKHEMAVFHDLLNVVMPDDRTAKPGSAHALCNELLLADGKTFSHGKSTRDFGCVVRTVDTVGVTVA